MRTDTKLPTFNFLGKDKWLPLITTREGNFDKNLRIKTSEYRLYGKLHRGGSAWSGNRYWGIHWSHIYFCPNLIVPRGAVSYFFLHLYRSAHCLVGSSQWIFMNKVANMPLRKYLPRDLWQCLPSQSTCENTQRGEDVGEGCVCVRACVCVCEVIQFISPVLQVPAIRKILCKLWDCPAREQRRRQARSKILGYIIVEKNEISFSHTI